MKIKVDLSELARLGRIMMPEGSNFTLGLNTAVFEPIDVALRQGKEIRLDDLDSGTELLSVQGRQVLLYIKDHTNRFDVALQDGVRGNRFHIAHYCQTLVEMERKNRSQRYVGTNRLDGRFPIEEASSWGGQSRIGEAALKVCKYCLQRLNYKNSSNYTARQKNFDTFSLAEFFSQYSTCFKYMPSMLDEQARIGYSLDWPERSKQVREAAGYVCSQCRINLSQHHRLCHVHHVNGVKPDNSPGNLRVLCKDCHRKQPMHGSICISAEEMDTISSLRVRQDKLVISDWKSIYDFSDTAIHGDLGILQNKGYPPPVFNHGLMNERGDIVTFEAAWPDKRMAIGRFKTAVADWKVYQVGEIAGEAG